MPGKSVPRICVDGDKEWPIVLTVSGHSDKAIVANQHLIAAAPEMLEALEAARAELEQCEPPDEYPEMQQSFAAIMKQIDAALAKSRGET